MPQPKLKLHTQPADLTAGRDAPGPAPGVLRRAFCALRALGQRATRRTRDETVNPRSKRALWLGWAGGRLAQLLGGRWPPVAAGDLRRHDYRISTQRMGFRFSERIRDTFRWRWLRKMP